MPAWFYILRLRSSGLYCGATKHRDDRIKDHFSGHGCRTTKLDPPRCVAYVEEFETYSHAFQREQQVKRWSRAKKEALISGDLDLLQRLSRSKQWR